MVIYPCLEKPNWVHIEPQAVPTHTLDFLLWCPLRDRPSIMSPMPSSSIALWDRLKGLPALTLDMQPLVHILHNPKFTPQMSLWPSDGGWIMGYTTLDTT